MIDFIIENLNAMFIILGTIIGSTISIFGTIFSKNLEVKNRLLEKIIEKRIVAHEEVISLTNKMSSMVSAGNVLENGELARFPRCLRSKKELNNLLMEFYSIDMNSTVWLANPVTRELNFMKDYLVNLNVFLGDVDEHKYPLIGEVIRNDFIIIAHEVKQKTLKYLFKDFKKRKLNDFEKWHKYPLDVTKKRLNETILFLERDKISTIINS